MISVRGGGLWKRLGKNTARQRILKIKIIIRQRSRIAAAAGRHGGQPDHRRKSCRIPRPGILRVRATQTPAGQSQAIGCNHDAIRRDLSMPATEAVLFEHPCVQPFVPGRGGAPPLLDSVREKGTFGNLIKNHAAVDRISQDPPDRSPSSRRLFIQLRIGGSRGHHKAESPPESVIFDQHRVDARHLLAHPHHAPSARKLGAESDHRSRSRFSRAVHTALSF